MTILDVMSKNSDVRAGNTLLKKKEMGLMNYFFIEKELL